MRDWRGRAVGPFGISVLAVAALLLLTACNNSAPATPPSVEGSIPAALPERSASGVIRSAEGGTVGLSDGAEVVFAREAVVEPTDAVLRVLDKPPAVPSPRSLIGRAYQLSLAGGSLSGVARVTLPLPSNVSPDAYDLAPYRWTGQAWERLTPRFIGQKVQFGISEGGVYALQGQWRLADAALALALPALEPGRPTTPVAVVGQYRYATLPALQGEYVPARLILKRDSSGGAGQVTGDETRDETIAEALLLFKPDPASPRGVIEFSHVFEVRPGDVKAPPASVSRLYAILIVEDSAAPTRRFSSGIEYTQLLPIQIAGAEVIRPELAADKTPPLRWNVRLNGYPLLQKPATALTLSLPDLLAEGGLGEYHIVLEAQLDGKWLGVSNEVTVQLRLPASPTPTATATRFASATPVATPAPGGAGTVTLTPPQTPTRRPAPGERTSTPAGPSPTPTAALPTITSTPTRPAWASVFWADRYILTSGECTTLYWNVENVTAVYLDGVPTTGKDSRVMCPSQTTTYVLRVVSSAGTQDRSVTITVRSADQAAVEFTADRYEIVKGQCIILSWRTSNVTAVYLNGEGVAGEASKKVCPETTAQYELRVETGSDTPTIKTLTINVLAAEKIAMRFWAEQYTFQSGNCTTLHWNVQDVTAVYFAGATSGDPEGVAGVGTRQVCPTGTQSYTLTAEASGDRKQSKRITLQVEEPVLAANEVIAQGVINEVNFVTALDPNASTPQPGYQVVVDGINPLFSGTSSCCQAVVKLLIPQTVAELAEGPVDWPINPGQLIEFRATCQNSTCDPTGGPQTYARLRSD